MILGLGLDVVATDRVVRQLAAHASSFEERVFTAAERAECHGRADPAQALAARFAAKEACLKALGTGWGEGASFLQVEVRSLGSGVPTLELSGGAAKRAQERGVQRVHVSLSHEQGIAAATVILEG